MKNFTDIFKKIGGLYPENEIIPMSSIKKVPFGSKMILLKEGKISNKIFIVEKVINSTAWYFLLIPIYYLTVY